MGIETVIETRIDAEVRDRAFEILEGLGLSLSDAIRILLTQVAEQGAFPLAAGHGGDAHDAWFRGRVRDALADPRPDISDAEATRHFARRREAASRRAAAGQR